MPTALTNPVDAYAIAVQAGELPAGKYHRLACARHLRDRQREGKAEWPYVFDLRRADRLWRFAEQLKHYKGKWAGEKIRLEPHQKFRMGSKVGWVHRETGLRRFRNSYEEIPRKNGKSLEAAVFTLYLTFFDNEGGAEGYCAATKRDQAKIVFNDAKRLVQSSGLRSRLLVQQSNISHDRTASKLEPLSADHNSLDGLNPSVVNIDEMHAHKDRGLIDVMETGTGSRTQPFINKITTAGDSPTSPCGDEHDYACKILDRVLDDDTYFAFIASADPEDDWTLPATAQKANPNYGVSVNPADLASKVLKAMHMPSAAASYKQKHLDLWVNSSQPWLSLDGWQKGQSRNTWTAADLEGESCYIGIDLASKIDLCPLVAVFPPVPGRKAWRLLRWIWTPEETLRDRAHRDRAPYELWRDQGYLLTTPGTRVDHQVIRGVLREIRERFDIEAIGFDPWHADTLIQQLTSKGADGDGFGVEQVLEVPQTYAGMGSAAKRFEADVLAGDVDAQGDPVMRWCVSNAVAQRDGKDNIYPVKKKSRGRIDPVMATLIGMALYLKQPVVEVPHYSMLVVGGR